MKLRWAALVAWVLAFVFVSFVAPTLQSPEFKNLLANRETLTVDVRALSAAIPVKGFAGSTKYSFQGRVLSSGAPTGKSGSLSGSNGVKNVSAGDQLKVVISVRPAFRTDEEFSATIRHVLFFRKESETDLIGAVRNSFLANLAGVTPDAAALVAGLTIGDDTGLSNPTKDELKVVSLTHLSAVSGTNCAIVLAGTALLLGLLPIRRAIRLLLSFAVIFAYLALVGPEPSVLRASVMVAAVLAGYLFGRRVPPLDALSLAVIILMIYEPSLALDYGFALSSLATLGLLVLAPKLVQFLERKIPRWLAIVISVSLAAQIACLPVLLMLQPTIPVYSILANVVAEPMVAPITVIGLLACLVSPVFPAVAVALCQAASMPAQVILFVAHQLANAPSASIAWVSGVSGIFLAVFLVGCIWVFFVSKKSFQKRLAGIGALIVLLSLFAQSSSFALQRGNFYSGDYTLVNCDVGQGDALVIKSQGQVAVVDVGRENPAIDSCLTNLGISKIDLLVLTHYDLDHVGGVLGAITGREVAQALVTSFADSRPGADFAQQVLSAQGIPMVESEKGMSGTLGEFEWLVLAPHRGAPEAEDSNDASTSMYWTDSRIALFTLADSGERAQLRMGSESRTLLESDFGSKIVVVKVAHHGSRDQAPEFYEAINPEIAMISVGLQNSYGHPTKRTLDLFSRLGSQVLRTDEMGAIGISETESGLEVAIAGRS